MNTEKIATMNPHTQVTGYSGGGGSLPGGLTPVAAHWLRPSTGHPISMTSPTGSNWEGADGNQRRPVGRYGMCMEPMGVD